VCPPPPKKKKKVGTTHTHKSAIDKIIINAKDIEKKEKEICDPNLFNCNKTKDINGLVTTRNEFPQFKCERDDRQNIGDYQANGMGVSSIL
jgi:hypothetical protein